MIQGKVWILIPLILLLSLSAVLPGSAWAGNTHSEGGVIQENLGVPETDGMAPVTVYWTGDSSDRATMTVGNLLAGHWLGDAGFQLNREWQVGDGHIAVLEFEQNAGVVTHAGFYSVINKTLSSLDPDEYPSMTVRAVPTPVATAQPGHVTVNWAAAVEDVGSPSTTNVIGYNLYRSVDGIAFTQLNTAILADTSAVDSTGVVTQTYFYAISLAYRGTPTYEGTAKSSNSNGVSPLDTTPPSSPQLIAEPKYTQGLTNVLAWSDESASGATEYLAEASIDSAFTTIAVSSGWQASNTYTFNGLTDGVMYYYRVRARDFVANESTASGAVSSQQDATAPQSNMLALTNYATSSMVNLEWTAADSVSGVQSVQLFFTKDGGAITAYAGGPFASSPIAFDASLVGGDGNYTFYCVATDSAGNAEVAPASPDASTNIDTQAPSIPTLASLPTFSAGAELTLNWNDQAASGATAYRIQASAVAAFDSIAFMSAWISSANHSFTGLDDGALYYYRVQSRDAAGNESGFSVVELSTQDATAPTTTVDAFPAFSANSTLSVSWIGSDVTSGLNGVNLFYSFNGGVFTVLPGGPFTSSPIAFDAATMGGDGNYAFYALGTDTVNNTEAVPATAEAQVTVDTQAPNVPTVAAITNFSAGTSLPMSWNDESVSGASEYLAESSVDPTFATIGFSSGWISATTFTFNGLTDATTYFTRMRARDAAGNETISSPVSSTTMDASPAASLVGALPTFMTTSAFSVNWTAADSTSGVDHVDLYFTFNGGPATLYPNGPFTTSPISFDATSTGGQGTYEFYTIATDIVGNQEAAPLNADATTALDTQAPNAPTLAGAPTFTQGTTLTLSWADAAAVEYMAEASTDVNFTTTFASSGWITGLSHEFTGLADGQLYYYRTRGRDAAGNESSSSALVQSTQDATAPASSLDPLTALQNNSVLSLAWSGNDATSGLSNVDLYFSTDGGAATAYSGGPFASSPIAFDATVAGGDGDYTFYTVAHDIAGNNEAAPATSDAQTHIDTAAPTPTTIANSQAFTAGSSVVLAWSNESASGASDYIATMSTTNTFASVEQSSGWTSSLTHNFSALMDGQEYFFRVQARDTALNEAGFSTIMSTTMDSSSPISSVDALPTLSASAQLAIAWSGTDATSGLTAVELLYSKDSAPFATFTGGPFTVSPIAFDASTTGGEGNYSFYTVATDAVGNTELAPVAADAQTTIDTTPPNAPALAALATFTAGSSMNLNWANMSSSGAVEYMAQASTSNAFDTNVVLSPWQSALSYTFNSFADGQTYYFRVRARDAAQNETSYSAFTMTTMDATAPSSSVESLAAFATSSSIPIAWTGSDATSGLVNVDLYYSKDGAAFAMLAGGPFASSPIAFDASLNGGDGNYEFYTVARDAVNNEETSPVAADANTHFDTAAPNTPTLATLPGFFSGSSAAISWNDLSASGATEYRVQASTDASFGTLFNDSGWIAVTNHTFTGLVDGTQYYYRVQARDTALNESAFSIVLSATQDATPPNTPTLSVLPTFTAGSSMNLTWADMSGSGASEYMAQASTSNLFDVNVLDSGWQNGLNFTFNSLGDAQAHYFRVRARDQALNQTGFSVVTQTTMDATPPSSNVASLPTFATSSNLDIAWAGNDATSGLVNVDLYYSRNGAAFAMLSGGSFASSPIAFDASLNGGDGDYAFYTVAHDAVSNLEVAPLSPDATIQFDTAAPSAPTFASLPNFFPGTSALISWNDMSASGATEYRSQVSTSATFLSLFNDSGWMASTSHTIPGLTDGAQYYYRVQARDVAQNESAFSVSESFTMDATAPSSNVSLLPAFATSSALDIAWTGNDATSGLADVDLYYSKDGSGFVALSGGPFASSPIAFDASLDGGDGDYAFYTLARDAVNNIEAAPLNADANTRFDTAAPNMPTLASLPSVVPGTSLSISWNDMSASGATEYRAQVSTSATFLSLFNDSGWIAGTSHIFIGLTDGTQYYYRVQARDTALNESVFSGVLSATQDATPPSVPTLTALNTFTAGSSVNLTWPDLSSSGATEYLAQTSTSNLFDVNVSDSGWQNGLSFTVNNLPDGQTQYFRVRARDQVLNETNYSIVTQTTMDATAPTSNVESLPAFATSSSINIAWTGSDATSGVSGVELYYSRNGAGFVTLAGGPFASSPIAFDASLNGGDGDYEFYTVAHDGVNNVESSPLSADANIHFDTSAPSMPTLAALPTFFQGTSAQISWNDMSASGATEYRVQASTGANFGSIFNDSGWIAATSHTFTGLGDGTLYYYRVQARDTALNESAFANALSSTQDATSPTSSVSALPTATNVTPVQVAWTGNDATSGVTGVDLYYSRDGAPFALYSGGPYTTNQILFDVAAVGGDGVYGFYTRAHDGAGNIEAPSVAADAQTNVDTAAPQAPVIASVPLFSAGSTINVSWNDQSGSGAIEYRAQASTDSTFGGAQISSNWIPSTSFVFSGLTDGSTYYFRVNARDAALNETNFANLVQTTMDDTAPGSRVDAMSGVVTAEVFDVAWSGVDATSGLASVELYYSRDGGTFTVYPGGPYISSPVNFNSATTGGDGRYDFYTRALDNVNNQEAAPSAADVSIVLSTAPVGLALIDALSPYNQGTSIDIQWTAASGATEYLVQAAEDSLFNSIFAASGWKSGTNYIFDNLADGSTYYFRVRARNNAGVQGDFSLALTSTMDATAPMSSVAPIASKGSSQTLDILWTATDATSGVAAVDLMVSRNDGPFVAFVGGPFATSPIAFDAAAMGGDGQFAFYTIAVDNAGNIEDPPTEPDTSTLIDTQAPQIPSMLIEPGVTVGFSNQVSWNAITEANEYNAQCALDVEFQNVIATSGWVAATQHTFANLDAGTTYYYRVRARDASLNMTAYSNAVSSQQALQRQLGLGWNLVSFDLNPTDAAIDVVLQPIAGKYSLVRGYRDGQFVTYIPSLPVFMNDLQVIDPKNGYWIYMTEAATLAVGGEPISVNTPIDMSVGWELVSYLPDANKTPSDALVSINESLILARSYDNGTGYHSYYPGFGALSDLNAMTPGAGYWMFMGSADQLIYGTVGMQVELAESPTASRRKAPTVGKATVSSVPSVMDIWSNEITVDGAPAPVGTVIEAYDETSRLLGTYVIQKAGVMGAMHLPGDVSITEVDEGAVQGEVITLKVRDADFEIADQEPITWSANAFDHKEIAFTNKADRLPRVYVLDQNYPNPFNPVTTITYAVPGKVDGAAITSTPIKLHVYDIRGSLVRVLVESRQAPGNYTVRWDGKNDRGRAVSAGVYFYRLKTKHILKTRKMMMIK